MLALVAPLRPAARRQAARQASWWSRKREEREARVQELVGEAKNTHFSDFAEVNKTGGKLYEARGGLLPLGEARRFPAVEGERLDGSPARLPDLCAGRVALVLSSLKGYGAEMLPPWRDAFTEAHPGAACVQLTVVTPAWLRFAGAHFRGNLAAAMPPALRDDAMVAYGADKELQAALGVTNQLVGYVHLLDETGLVRWTAVGRPAKGELEAMVANAAALLGETATGWKEVGRRSRRRGPGGGAGSGSGSEGGGQQSSS